MSIYFQIGSNVFANSTRTALFVQYVDDGEISVKNNTFYNNTYTDGCAGAHVSYRSEVSEAAKLDMKLNLFYQNKGATIVQVILY